MRVRLPACPRASRTARLRHNRRMDQRIDRSGTPGLPWRAWAAAAAAASALWLAGCDLQRAPADGDLPGLALGDAALEWRGMRGCADCDGIETVLVLERAGDMQRFELVETYLATPDAARFADSGDWSLDGQALRLQADDGAQRHYALLRGGRLQPGDAEGRAFSRREADLLLPAAGMTP